MNQKYERASMWQIIRYGFGGVGSNVAAVFVMTYAATFFTNYLGISPLAMGALLLAPRLVDAFFNPFVGIISDRTRTRMGRFRPYIIFGAPVMGLSLMLLFINWGMTGSSILVFCYVLYILHVLAAALVDIPYHSLTPLMTEDPNQRTTVAITKQFMGFIAIIPVLVVVPLLLSSYPGNPMVFTYSAIAVAVIITISYWICAHGAKKKDTLQRIERFEGPAAKKSKISFGKQLQVIFKNRALLMLMIAFGTDFVAAGAVSGIGIYYFRDVVGNVALASLGGLLPMVVGIPVMFLLTPVTKKFGKKSVFIFGSTTQMIVAISLFFIPSQAITLILVQAALAGLFMPLTAVLGWAMAADCVEYGEWVSGINAAGTVTSQVTFINKLGNAIGGFLLGLLLAVGGYNAQLAVQAQQTQTMIIAIRSLLPALGFLASIISMAFYPITKDKYDVIIKENEQRRALKLNNQ